MDIGGKPAHITIIARNVCEWVGKPRGKGTAGPLEERRTRFKDWVIFKGRGLS